jgi:hypothetical protein
LTVLKEKYASKIEEQDVVRVELNDMKSRPSLLGACTSCPILHEKLDALLVDARSLEAQLKALKDRYGEPERGGVNASR